MFKNTKKEWVKFYNNEYKEFFINIKALKNNPNKETIYRDYLKSELKRMKADYITRDKNTDDLIRLDSIKGQLNQIKAIESIIQRSGLNVERIK